MKLADQPRRILLIDDNADARELLGMGLEMLGHSVVMAGRRRASFGRIAFSSTSACPA
jgi:CheY-like chemotaxis protein